MNRPAGAAAVLLGAVLLSLLPATAPAQAASPGSLTATVSGVPSRVALGGNFEITITNQSSSDDSILVDELSLDMWLRSGGAPDGVTLEWQNPSTGQWLGAKPASSGGWYLSGRGLATIPPHGTLVTHARVSMGGAATGGYGFNTSGVIGYELLDPSGNPIAGHLDSLQQAQGSFAYGSGGGGSTPATGAATAVRSTPPAAATARATRTTDAPPPSPSDPPAPIPSATSAPADTPSPSASPAPSDTPSPSPSRTAITLANTGSSGSSVAPLGLGAAAVLAAAVAGAVVVLRRRRTQREQPADG